MTKASVFKLQQTYVSASGVSRQPFVLVIWTIFYTDCRDSTFLTTECESSEGDGAGRLWCKPEAMQLMKYVRNFGFYLCNSIRNLVRFASF